MTSTRLDTCAGTTTATPWTLAVLPTTGENFLPLLDGQEDDEATAFAAAVAALVDVAAALGPVGRQEYRITVAGRTTIVMPGLTAAGVVDLDALRGMGQPAVVTAQMKDERRLPG